MKKSKESTKKIKYGENGPYTKQELPEALFDPDQDRKITAVPRPFVGYPETSRVFP